MKHIYLFSLLFGALVSTNIKAQVPPDSGKKLIVLVNPGLYYLKSMVFLTENGIIAKEKYEYLAVFYTKSEVKISSARSYVRKHNIDYIKFKEVYGNLNTGNIYKKNNCTGEFANIFGNSDGIIFFGGWDIPPAYYGQKTELTVGIKTPNRHLFELSFLFHLLGGSQNPDYVPLLEKKPEYPVLGICLGMQTMNVATGGSLYQDIPTDIYGLKYVEDVIALGYEQMHRNYYKQLYPQKYIDNHNFHHIKITDKILRQKWNIKSSFKPLVASSHHQAVRNTGKGFRVAATSLDGKVVEALMHNKYPNVLGLQFHPEFYSLYDPDSEKIKFKPDERELLTEHEVLLRDHSYEFHVNIWKKFIKDIADNKR